MLIRILNTLRSRIWDRVFFLFSGYLNLQLGNVECTRRIWLSEKLNSKGLTFKFLVFIPLVHQISTFVWETRGLPRRLWFSLEWISLEEDTFLLDCIKIIFIYSYLMENFSLVNSHSLLGNPLILPQIQILISFWSQKAENQKFNIEENVKIVAS